MSPGEVTEAQRDMLTYPSSHRREEAESTHLIGGLRRSLCSQWPTIGFMRITELLQLEETVKTSIPMNSFHR